MPPATAAADPNPSWRRSPRSRQKSGAKDTMPAHAATAATSPARRSKFVGQGATDHARLGVNPLHIIQRGEQEVLHQVLLIGDILAERLQRPMCVHVEREIDVVLALGVENGSRVVEQGVISA